MRRCVSKFLLGAAVIALGACQDGEHAAPTAPIAGQMDVRVPSLVQICHEARRRGELIEVPAAAVPSHLAHGDYVARLEVSATATSGDGVHFRRITDALQAARASRLAQGELVTAACRITIVVSAGTFRGTTADAAAEDVEQFPMLVDVPDITLRGALEMTLDRDGRATGTGIGGVETVLTPAEPLPVVNTVSTPIIIADARPGGSAGNGLVVQGFVFQSGHDPAVDAGGQGVLTVRAARVAILGNRFEGGFTESMDLRGGSGDVARNHLGGTAGTCDVCLAGPGSFRVHGNTLEAGGIPGIVLSGALSLPVPDGVEPLVLPATAETWGDIRNNAVRDHQRVPVGVGVRVDVLGVNAPNVYNTVHAVIQDNLLVNNRFGIIVHAQTPKSGSSPLRSDAYVTLGGNAIEQSCEAKLLVSLARHQTALGIGTNLYMQNSRYAISLRGNLDWSEAWYGNPDGYGNVLTVDGDTIPNGVHQAYDATKVCS